MRRPATATPCAPDPSWRQRNAAAARTAGCGAGGSSCTHPSWNPSYVFWDAALDGRLPFTKIEVLRDDPYRMGNDRILATLERAHPEAFDGVREYIDRTRDQIRQLRGIGGPR